MGIVIRQSSISTALTFLGIGLGYLNVLYFFPKYLTPDQFGLTRVIQDFAMLMVPFAQFGVSQATIRFFPSHTKNKSDSGSFLTLMLGLAFLGFIVFLLLFTLLNEPITGIFSSKSPEVNRYISLILILTFILAINGVIIDYSRSLLKIIAPNFLKEVLLRLFTTISIFLYVFRFVDFDGFILCIVGAYLFNLILLIFYLRGKGQFKLNFALSDIFSKSDIFEIIKYGFYALIGASGAIIISKIDSVMVTSLKGTYYNGIYTMAFYMAVVIEVPRRMIAQIATPLISRALEKEDLQEVNTLYGKTALNQLIIGALILIGLWANLDNIYFFVPNNEIYELGKWVVIIIGVAKLVDMAAGLNGEIIILSKHYKVNIIFTGLLALFTIAFNLYLIPRYGIIGAAIGTAISLILFNITKFLFLLKTMSFQPFTINNFKVLLIAGIVLFLALLSPRIDNPLLDLIVRSALITVIYSTLILMSKVSVDINELFDKGLKIIRKRQ